MRLTLFGKAALFLIFLTLWNAINGGLNTLYMVYSALAAGLLVSWGGARLASLLVEADVFLSDQIFCGDRVPLRITFRNRGILPVFGVVLRGNEGHLAVGDIGARGRAEVVLPYRFLRRGLSDITDLRLEFRFPFGLLVRERPLPVRRVTVFPQPIRFAGKPFVRGASLEEVSRPRRGAGEEFWGVREFVPGDDAKLISWRLSAKAGRPLIREFAEMVGDRAVIRVQGRPHGEATEMRIREAASLARYFIDEGAEVRLETDEGAIDYARGLVQLEAILRHLALLGEGRVRRGTGAPQTKKTSLRTPLATPPLFLCTYAMAAAAALSLLIVEGLDPLTKIAAALAIPAGILCDRSRRYPVPPSIFNILNIAAIALVLFVDIPLEGLLPGLTHLVAYALVNRLVSPKGPSDSGIIALICFLLFILISWQTIAPLYLAAFVVFLALAGLWLAAIGDEAFRIDRRRLAAQGLATLAVLSLAGGVFAATPRVMNPRFAQMMRRLGLSNMVAPEFSIVKLADRVRLGVFDDVRTNGRRIMQAKVAGMEVAPGGALYIRGGALDRFDGTEWRRSRYDFFYRRGGETRQSSNGRVFYDHVGPYAVGPAWAEGKRPVIEEFFLYPMATPLVFSVGDPTAIEGVSLQPFYDLGGTVFASQDHEEGAHYTVYSLSDEIRTDAAIEGYDEALEALFLELPKGDEMEPVRRMANAIAGSIADPEGKARAIEARLRNDFVYSYLGRHGRQTLAEFLTETSAGNCEYFATAMALMLRAQGVPARLVVGYVTTDWKQVGEYFDVRNSDGHAWVEAYLPGRGWAMFDPTPDAAGALGPDFFLGRELSLYLLGLQMSWYRYVIGYDFYLQQDVFLSAIQTWRTIVAAIAIAAALAAAIAGAVIVGRTWFLPGRSRTAPQPAADIYRGIEKLLARYGFRRDPWQTPLEFAARIIGIEPRLSAAERTALVYYRVRFGGSGKEELSAAVAELRTALKRYAEARV